LDLPPLDLSGLVLYAVLAGALSLHWPAHAQTISTNTWAGPGPGANDWSAGNDWSLGRAPGSKDYVVFTYLGASSAAAVVNNVVDANFGGTIGTLSYQNIMGAHTTLIMPGKTLVLTGGLTADVTAPPSSPLNTNTITGPGAGLVISNSTQNLVVHDLADSGNFNTLDMSGLDTFSAGLGRVVIADGGGTNNAGGVLLLAKTNTIVASGAAPGILVSGGGTNVQIAKTAIGGVVLGQMNTISADIVTVGSGYGSSTMAFNPGFSNSMVRFRGQDGVSRVSQFIIGDGANGFNDTGSFYTNYGAADFSLGTVDLLADKILVGRVATNSMASSDGRAKGLLSLSEGTIDVNTLEIGLNPWDNQGTLTNRSSASGTVLVEGPAKLVVNTALELGNSARTNSLSSSQLNSGILNVIGGTVMAARINAAFPFSTNLITVSNGVLMVSNTAGPGISTFALAGSILQIPASASPSVLATNLLTGGFSNTINVASLPRIGFLPAQLPLVGYSGSIGGAGFNFSLGSSPSGSQSYTGYLTNNTSSPSIDLVVSSYTPSAPLLAGQVLNGQFQLFLSGDPGRAVEVLISSNLTDWAWLITLTNTTGNIAFPDPTADAAQRFYRAQQF
jgi:hypothetical protein